jgi:hypothetical protein
MGFINDQPMRPAISRPHLLQTREEVLKKRTVVHRISSVNYCVSFGIFQNLKNLVDLRCRLSAA